MFKNYIKPTLVLIIIAGVMSGMLAFTYNVAGIADLGKGIPSADLELMVPNVLPTASQLELASITVEDEDVLAIYKDEGGTGAAVYLQTVGYGKTPIKMIVGINTDGTVAGAEIVESSETPGLGTKIEEPSYISQYVGKKGVISGKSEGGEIDYIAGVTKSCEYFTAGVNKALVIYEQVKGEL